MRKLFLISSLLALIITASAQNGSIRGFIYDKSSGEPIMFCNVFLEGTTIGTATDLNGMYNITKIKTLN